MKRLTSLRITDYTTAQIQQLRARIGANQTEIVALAIDRMYRQEFGNGINPMKQEIAMQIQDRGNYEPAAERVENEPTLYQYKDLLLETDWHNEAEHLDWVATADIAEIVDWCETIREAEQTA